MADLKISQLPAATTALVGTEVLPIVQSGVTAQVSVANLTAGRNVDGTSFTVTGSTVPVNGLYLPAANTVGISANSIPVIRFNTTALGVNYWSFAPAVAGSGVRTMAAGASTDIAVQISTKGASNLSLWAGDFTQVLFSANRVANGVNWLEANASATGNAVIFSSAGNDAAIEMAFSPKGGAASYFTTNIETPSTITAAATTGNQTINKMAGSVNFAGAATTLTVTNSLVTANSVVIATVATNDATMKSVCAVAGAGSFVLTADAAATGETRVNFLVINKGD